MNHRLMGPVAGVVAALALVGPASVQAAQPGEQCQAKPLITAKVRIDNTTFSSILYTISGSQWFRIEAYAGTGWYRGHGAGAPSGYMVRSDIDQSTCKS